MHVGLVSRAGPLLLQGNGNKSSWAELQLLYRSSNLTDLYNTSRIHSGDRSVDQAAHHPASPYMCRRRRARRAGQGKPKHLTEPHEISKTGQMSSESRTAYHSMHGTVEPLAPSPMSLLMPRTVWPALRPGKIMISGSYSMQSKLETLLHLKRCQHVHFLSHLLSGRAVGEAVAKPRRNLKQKLPGYPNTSVLTVFHTGTPNKVLWVSKAKR